MPLLGSLAAGSVKGFGAQANLGYFLGQSLRFRRSASAYLERTPTSSGNRRTWTWSGWIKGFKDEADYQYIFQGHSGNVSGGIDQGTAFRMHPAEVIQFYCYTNAAFNFNIQTTRRFRDPAAWYHIVIAVDTTQATASNRVKIYVNGELETVFDAADYPSQNYDTYINHTNAHYIGSGKQDTSALELFFDGYMGDVYLIDGQQLTPSDFGKTDPSTGSWIPKKYSGTYGTNGFYLDFKEPNPNSVYYSFDVDGTGDYISAPAAQYANYINGSGDFTIEWWVNYDALPSDGAWYAQDSGSAVVSPFNLFQQTNSWRLYATTADAAWNVFSNTLLATTSLTTGRWYHIACVRNGTTLTLYVDGVSQGSQTIGTASLWQDTTHNLSLFNDWQSAGGGGGINGRISNYRIVKGTAVYTGNFTPPTELLEDITNTTLLMARSTSIADLSGNITISGNGNLAVNNQVPPLANGPGKDISGNDNHWGLKDIVFGSENSAATTYDLMNDVPTLTSADKGNFATWNPLSETSNLSTVEANLGIKNTTTETQHRLIRATMAMSSGKYYWEVNVNNSAFVDMVGIINSSYNATDNTTVNANNGFAYGYSTSTGNWYVGTNWTSDGTTPSAFPSSGIIGVAFDADNGKLYFSRNNTWINSANPSAGTGANATYTGNETEFLPAISIYNNTGTWRVNFGQRPFAYTPPTGYKKLNTYNL